MEQIFMPTVAWLFLDMINGHTALALDSHRGDAEAGTGCHTVTWHQHGRS